MKKTNILTAGATLSLAVMLLSSGGAMAATAGGVGFKPVNDTLTVKSIKSTPISFTDNDLISEGNFQNTDATYVTIDGTNVKVGQSKSTANGTHAIKLVDGKVIDDFTPTFIPYGGKAVTEVVTAYTQGIDIPGVPVDMNSGTQTITINITPFAGVTSTASTRSEALTVAMNSGEASYDIVGDTKTATGATWNADSFKILDGANKVNTVNIDAGTVGIKVVDGKATGTFTPAKDYKGVAPIVTIEGKDSTGTQIVFTNLTVTVTEAELSTPPVEETPVETPTPVEETPVPVEETPSPVITIDDTVVTNDGTVNNGENWVTDAGKKDAYVETSVVAEKSPIGIIAVIGGLILGFGAFVATKLSKRKIKEADTNGVDTTDEFQTVEKPVAKINAPKYD